MIITIDSKTNRVRRIRREKPFPIVNNKTTFEVESAPTYVQDTILYFNPETKEFYTEVNTKAIIARAEAKKAWAMKWLSDNDWKVNKRTLGEWAEDDPRWLAYLEGREKARKAYDDAVAVLEAKESE